MQIDATKASHINCTTENKNDFQKYSMIKVKGASIKSTGIYFTLKFPRAIFTLKNIRNSNTSPSHTKTHTTHSHILVYKMPFGKSDKTMIEYIYREKEKEITR